MRENQESMHRAIGDGSQRISCFSDPLVAKLAAFIQIGGY